VDFLRHGIICGIRAANVQTHRIGRFDPLRYMGGIPTQGIAKREILANDAFVLRLRSHHEARGIAQRDDRQSEGDESAEPRWIRALEPAERRRAKRLIERQDDYLRFTTDWRIPADNNGSERDIRMIKLRQKVSGCLRTLAGARQFCAIRSYLSTARKQGINALDALTRLHQDQAWMPATS